MTLPETQASSGVNRDLSLIRLDREGRIIEVGAAAARLLERNVEDLSRRGLHEIFRAGWTAAYPWLDELQTANAIIPPRILELETVRRDGTLISLDGVLYAIRAGRAQTGEAVAGLKLRPSPSLVTKSELLTGQREVLELVAGGTTLRETLLELATFAERVIPGEVFCSITPVNTARALLEAPVQPTLPREVASLLHGRAVGEHATPCSGAASGEEIVTPDLDAEPQWHDFAERLRRHGLVAVWSHPIQSSRDARTIAVLEFYLPLRRSPSRQESQLIVEVKELVRLAFDLHGLAQELVERELQLKNIIAETPLMLWQTDHDGRFTVAEGRGLHSVGMRSTDMTGHLPAELFGLDHAVTRAVMRGLAGESVTTEVEIGRSVFALSAAPRVDAHGRVQGTRGIALDITAQREAERLARQRYEQMRLVVEATTDGFWDLRLDRDGSMISDRCALMLGYRPGDLKPVPPPESPLIHPDDRADVERAWRDHLEGRTPRYEVEHRRRARDGSWRWIIDRGKVVERDESGHPSRVAGTLTDVSERRTLEASLLAAQKMEALGLVAGGFAHDLNNILSAIRGHASLAAVAQGVPPKVAESLEVIQLAVNRAKALTQNMLSLGRPEPLQRRLTSAVEVVRDTVRLLQPTLPRQIELEVIDRTSGDDQVYVDPNQLQQAIMNLAINARDAIAGAGRMTFSVDHAPDTRALWIRIRDTGCGIEPSDIARIFDPFFTRKPAGQGSGLGLAVVRSFVDSNGGSISVTSEPGRGSEFTIELPLPALRGAAAGSGRGPHESGRPASGGAGGGAGGTDEHGRTVGAAAGAAPPGVIGAPARRGRGGSLVLGEDHPLLRPMLVEALQAAGYTVAGCADGPEVVERAVGLGGTLGALVVDVNMPRLTGPECLEEITRRLGRDVPTVFITGGLSVEPPNGESRRIAVVRKPFDLDALLRAIAGVLEVADS